QNVELTTARQSAAQPSSHHTAKRISTQTRWALSSPSMLREREHSQRPMQNGRSTAYEAATLHRSSTAIDCISWMTAPMCLPSTRLLARSFGNTRLELCREHRLCLPMENCTSEPRTESFLF